MPFNLGLELTTNEQSNTFCALFLNNEGGQLIYTISNNKISFFVKILVTSGKTDEGHCDCNFADKERSKQMTLHQTFCNLKKKLMLFTKLGHHLWQH